MDDVAMRARVLACGFELLCVPGHPGGVRNGRVVYGWDPSPEVRVARLERGLRAALRRRDDARRVTKKRAETPTSRP